MDYAAIKSDIEEIVSIAASVPEPFREKCFELLLTALIEEHLPGRRPGQPTEPPVGTGRRLDLPEAVQVFLAKHQLTPEELQKVVMAGASGEIHFIREPAPKPVAKAQIEWALLIGLKSALEQGSFLVDPEAIRSLCQDKGCYDRANFARHFKAPGNAALFKGAMEPQGEPRPLATTGDTKLAELVKRLAGEAPE